MTRSIDSLVPDWDLVIWLASGTLLFLLIVATFIQPFLKFPDESFHIDMIFAATDGDGYPRVDTRPLSPSVVAANVLMGSDRMESDVWPPRQDEANTPDVCTTRDGNLDCTSKPTFDELEQIGVDPGPPNRMAQHPPAYYLVVGQTIATLTSLTMHHVPFDMEIWLYRVASVVLVATTALFTGLSLRYLAFPRSTQVAGALVPATLPGLVMRSGVLVSNDALLYPLIGALILVFVQIHIFGFTSKRSAVIGILLGLSILTKGTAMLVAATIPFCFLLLGRSGWSTRQRLRQSIKSTVLVAAVTFIAGGWWVFRNIIVYGTPQPAGASRPNADASFAPDPVEWLVGYMKGLVRTSLGSPGRELLQSPELLTIAVVAIVSVLVLGIRIVGWRLSLALNLPLILIFLGWSANSFVEYVNTGQVVAWNARYYFAAMPGIYIVLVAGAGSLVRRLRWLPPTIVPASIFIVSLLAAFFDARYWIFRYWTDEGTWSDGWHRLMEWSPVPFSIAWVAITLSVIAGIMSVFGCTQWLRTNAD